MITPPAPTLPATVQVITTLTPLIPCLSAPWQLTYERDEIGTGRRRATVHAYSAAVERGDEAPPDIPRCWDLGLFLRQLAAHIRARAEGRAAPAPKPIRRSPLEFGKWLTKKKFEKRYQLTRWLGVVVIDGGSVRVRVSPYKLINLIREHKDAYFQFVWNTQPHERQQKIQIKGRRSAERFETIPITDPPYTTIKTSVPQDQQSVVGSRRS